MQDEGYNIQKDVAMNMELRIVNNRYDFRDLFGAINEILL